MAARESAIDFLEVAQRLLKWKRFIAVSVLSVSAAVAVISLILPKYYISTTVIMPPENDEIGLSSLARGMPFRNLLGGASLGIPDAESQFLAILESRTLRMAMIERFNLVHVYKFDKSRRHFIEDVLKRLSKDIYINVTSQGTIEVGAGAEDPKLAAAMAGFMVANLDSIYKCLRSQAAHNRRVFLENRIGIVQRDLKGSEDAYASFQKEHKAVNPDAQARATIDVATGIESEYAATQMKLDLAREFLPEGNPTLTDLERQLRVMRLEKSKLTRTRISDILLPLASVPDVSLELARLERNVKIQEVLYEFLVQQYEQAKLEEARDTPQVQVLDKAPVPQKRAKPKRRIMVLAAFAGSLFVSVVLAGVFERIRDLKRTGAPDYARLITVGRGLVDWRS